MAAIKRWNGLAWEETYPKTTTGNIIATGTPSSSTFLRGDGAWATPPSGTGDVVGPASSVNTRIATFNGTTGKLIQDSGFTTSSFASATHSHGNINSSGQITSATQTVATGDHLIIRDVSNSSLISVGPAFGTSTATFLGNDGQFRAPFQVQTLTSNLNTAEDTNWVTVFTFTSLPAGTYGFMMTGRYARTGTTTSRSFDLGITGSSVLNYTLLEGVAMRANLSNAVNGTASNISHLSVPASTLGTAGSFWSTNVTTTAITAGPFIMEGQFILTAATTMTVSMRQSAAATSQTVGLLSGTAIQLVRLA
jgi:hypothetical protein